MFQRLTRLFRGVLIEMSTAWIARRDGESEPPIPHWNAETMPPHCWRLVYNCDGWLQQTAQKWEKKDSKLLPNWDTAFREAGQHDAHVSEAEQKMKDAEQAYSDLNAGTKAPPTDFRHLLYWVIITILVIFELPFTAVAFRCIGDSDLLIYVVATAVSFALVGGAHFVGATIKEMATTENVGKINKVLVVALVAANLAALLGIAFFRAHYLSAAQSTGPTLQQPLGMSTPDETGTDQTAPISGFLALFTFLAFGLLLFLDVTALAFRRHNPALDAVFRRRKQVRNLLKVQRKANRRLSKAKAIREKCHGHFKAEGLRIITSVKGLVEFYRTISFQCRNDRGQLASRSYPPWFDKHGNLTLPKSLDVLEWHTALASPYSSADSTKPNAAKPRTPDHGAGVAALNTDMQDSSDGEAVVTAGHYITAHLNTSSDVHVNGSQPETIYSRR